MVWAFSPGLLFFRFMGLRPMLSEHFSKKIPIRLFHTEFTENTEGESTLRVLSALRVNPFGNAF